MREQDVAEGTRDKAWLQLQCGPGVPVAPLVRAPGLLMPLTTTDQWLDEAEASLGRRLPASLRELLKERNGGQLYAMDDAWEVHPVWDKRDRRHLTRTFNHLIAETMRCRGVDWYPADALAIAVCNADRLVLMPEDTTRYGDVVFFWDYHGDQLERVADSVLDLVDQPEDWDE